MTGFKPTASITIDSTKADPSKLAALEEILYGKDHEVLTEEPSDWSTNYSNYFTKSGEKYNAVSGISAPEFVSGTYYTADVAPRLPLPDEIASIMKVAA